jgi:hypothetical protein
MLSFHRPVVSERGTAWPDESSRVLENVIPSECVLACVMRFAQPFTIQIVE